MARRKGQATNNHPLDPRDLENLSIPPNYILSSNNECMLLWDSGYSSQTRRSLLWGTPTNASAASDAEHIMMDGTWKSAPNHFMQLFTLHGLFPDGWHLLLFYGLLPGKTTTLYRNLLQEIDSCGSDMETLKTSSSSRHGVLLVQLRKNLDRDFFSEPSLRSRDVEPT